MAPRILLCLALALLPTAACGQTETNLSDRTTPVTRDEFNELARAVQDNEAAVGRLTDGINNLMTRLSSPSSGNSEPSSAGESAAQADESTTPAASDDLAARIAALEQKIEVLTEVQHNHETQLGQIARQDQDGSYYLQLNTKNPAGRNEVRRAIQEAAPEVGKLIVTNRMASDQFLYVDGDGFRVPANMTREIHVRRGTVSTNLPGQESVLWTIAAPDYEQRIDIRPRQSQQVVTAARPAMGPTIFIDPWTGASYVASR